MRSAPQYILLAIVAGLFAAGTAFSADKYVIDPEHSSIGFSVMHLGVNKVKGKFNVFSGVIMADEKNLANCSVEVKIKVDSVDTNNEGVDTHLKTADFFDAKKFPVLTFKSKQVKKAKSGYTATGTLIMHGVSKEISIPFTFEKAVDPSQKSRIGIDAGFSINRQDYGLKWNSLMDNGGLIVGNDVKIELAVGAVKE